MKVHFEINHRSITGWLRKYWWALVIPAAFAGVFYWAWNPNPTQGISDPAEIERQLKGLSEGNSRSTRSIGESYMSPPQAKQEFAQVEVTGTVADGRLHAIVKVPASRGGGGLFADQSELVKTDTWLNGVLGFFSSILMMFAPFAVMAWMWWYFNRRSQTGVASGVMGMPRAAPNPGMQNSTPGSTPTGAPAGADLSFLTIIQPQDNPVRLDQVILDKGLKKKLVKIAESLGEKKRLYDAERSRLVAEEEEKGKKNGWFGGRDKSPTPIVIDMAEIKVKKPSGGLFKSKAGKAFLFTGGPGVGKTLAATAVAGSAAVPIIVISGTLENTLLGGGAQRVDIVMSIAAQLGPCLIFVDEAENAAGQRDKGGQKMGATSDGTTAKWLAAIDGVRQKVDKDAEFMGPSDMIYFAMATNYVDMMDEAIKRSGRLKVINFPLPTVPLLQRMLQLFIGKKKLPLGPDIDPTFLAAATMLSGKSGADIEEIANSFAEYCEDEVERISNSLTRQGKSEAQVKAVVDSLKFGQQAFLFGVIDHLMGAKIEDDVPDFNRDINTTLHELFHALAGAVAGRLGLSGDRMRLLCVSRRQRSLGVCFWSPAKGDRTNLSKRDVLGLTMIGYAGGAVQTLFNFFKYNLGKDLDFFTDSGASSDLSMCANLIKDNVALHNGSLNTGPISKGHNGRTYATEMGQDMVNEIDHEIRARQRLGYAIAHWICSALIASPIVWEMVEEVLISRDNLMVEERFYHYFERLMADENIRRQIEETLPTFIRQESEKAESSPINYTWVPPQPAPEIRNFVIEQLQRLEPMYEELQAKLSAEDLDDPIVEVLAQPAAKEKTEAHQGA